MKCDTIHLEISEDYGRIPTLEELKTDISYTKIEVSAKSSKRLKEIIAELSEIGASVSELKNANLVEVTQDKVAPGEFYSTTNHLTFVYVNNKKEFLGGVICAGLKTSYNSLFNNTSKLEQVKVSKPGDIIGKNTASCIQNGMIYGTSSMIDGIIKKFRKGYGDFTVILTGGDAKLISEYLDEKVIIDENLLLDGLYMIYKKNE